MAKLFKLEVEYFGYKYTKELEKLDDAVGVTLSLSPFVKVGIRDMTPQALFKTIVGLNQKLLCHREPTFSIPVNTDNGDLRLVPISAGTFGWRCLTVS